LIDYCLAKTTSLRTTLLRPLLRLRTMNQTATSFFIPRVCKRWMPADIMQLVNNLNLPFLTATTGVRAKVIRVDIVPIMNSNDTSVSFIERLNKEHHSVFLYFDAPIDYSRWSNGLKGGKQTRIYTGVTLSEIDENRAAIPGGKTCSEYWVLIPNRESGVIPFTTKTVEMLEAELKEVKEKLYKLDDLELFHKELEIWEYDWNCVQFHSLLLKGVESQAAFDRIYCAWVSIHQVASNVERLCARVC